MSNLEFRATNYKEKLVKVTIPLNQIIEVDWTGSGAVIWKKNKIITQIHIICLYEEWEWAGFSNFSNKKALYMTEAQFDAFIKSIEENKIFNSII